MELLFQIDTTTRCTVCEHVATQRGDMSPLLHGFRDEWRLRQAMSFDDCVERMHRGDVQRRCGGCLANTTHNVVDIRLITASDRHADGFVNCRCLP